MSKLLLSDFNDDMYCSREIHVNITWNLHDLISIPCEKFTQNLCKTRFTLNSCDLSQILLSVVICICVLRIFYQMSMDKDKILMTYIQRMTCTLLH